MSFPIDIQIPNAPNDPADDQPKIKDNFVNIDGFLSVDHVDPGATNNGMHKQVQLFNAAGTIPVGLITGTGTLYTETANSQTQLFYTNGSSGNEYQMTRTDNTYYSQFAVSAAYGTPPSGTQFGGWTFLPGGLLFQYGFYSNGSIPTGGIIEFPRPFSSFVFNVVATVRGSSGSRSVVIGDAPPPSVSSFNFLLSNSSNVDGIYWTAIGI